MASSHKIKESIKSRPIHSSKRTLSLFSGQTDLENKNARDGQPAPEENRKPPRSQAKKYHWNALEGSVWVYETRKYNRKTKTMETVEAGRVHKSKSVDGTPDRFLVYVGTEMIGSFHVMAEASVRLEVHFQ